MSDLARTSATPPGRWRFQAIDAAGNRQDGDLVAPSAADAITVLRNRSLWVTDLEPVSGAASPALPSEPRSEHRSEHRVGRWWARWSGRDIEALAVLTRAVATLLSAGLPLDRALDHVAGTPDAWAPTFRELRNRVQRGESLAVAASALSADAESTPSGPTQGERRALPSDFAPTFAAAEASGTLARTFGQLADHLERQARTEGAIRSALVYPTVLALASLVGTLVILMVVVPRFASLLADAGVPLPWATRLLVTIGRVMSAGGWLGVGGVLALIAAGTSLLRTPAMRERFHEARLGWPVIGAFERDRDGARYLNTLALALGAGVPLLTAMHLARRAVHNVVLAGALQPAERAVRDGGALSTALAGLLPPLSLRLLEAGETAGALAPLAQRAAEAADGAAQRRLAQIVSLIEPVMILGFGGLVGFVALALLQAIYGLNAGVL